MGVCHWKKKEEIQSVRFLEDRAHVVQPRDEAAPVRLRAAARAVRKADDVRTCLLQACAEAKPLRVIDERHESRFAVAVIAHQDRELAALVQGFLTAKDQQ